MSLNPRITSANRDERQASTTAELRRRVSAVERNKGSGPSGGGGFQPADGDLSALSALVGSGFAARTGAETWTTRTIMGTSGEIDVANGNGVSGNPTLTLPSTITKQITFSSQVVATNNSTEGFEVRGSAGGYSLHDRGTGATDRWVMYASTGTLKLWKGADIITFGPTLSKIESELGLVVDARTGTNNGVLTLYGRSAGAQGPGGSVLVSAVGNMYFDVQTGLAHIFRANAVNQLVIQGSITTGLDYYSTGAVESRGPGGGGYVRLVPGNATQKGYVGWHKADGTRHGYMGWDNNHIALELENGAKFMIRGGGLWTSDEVRMNGIGGRAVWTDNATNLWNIDNNAGTLRFFREDYNASGGGANGTVRMTIADSGLVTANNGFTVAAGTVTLPAGSLDGAALIDQSVTGPKLGIVYGLGNVAYNSSFEFPDAPTATGTTPFYHGWDILGGAHTPSIETAAARNYAPGKQALNLTTVASVTNVYLEQSAGFRWPAKPGEVWSASAYLGGTVARSGYIGIAFYNSAGGLISTSDSVPVAVSTSSLTRVTQPNATAPAGTAFVGARPVVTGTMASGESYFFDAIQLEKSTNVTAYSPRFDEMLPGSITATMLQAGVVTAEALNATLTITGKTIKTAASGARVEMDGTNNRLAIFNPSSAEILRLDGANGLDLLNDAGATDDTDRQIRWLTGFSGGSATASIKNYYHTSPVIWSRTYLVSEGTDQSTLYLYATKASGNAASIELNRVNTAGEIKLQVSDGTTNVEKVLLSRNSSTGLTTSDFGLLNGFFIARTTSAQTVANASAGTALTNTHKVSNISTTDFNHGSQYSTANSRHTPTIAGWYEYTVQFAYSNAFNTDVSTDIAVIKNNAIPSSQTTQTVGGGRWQVSSNGAIGPQGSYTTVMYMNGSTDYAEVAAHCTQASRTANFAWTGRLVQF